MTNDASWRLSGERRIVRKSIRSVSCAYKICTILFKRRTVPLALQFFLSQTSSRSNYPARKVHTIYYFVVFVVYTRRRRWKEKPIKVFGDFYRYYFLNHSLVLFWRSVTTSNCVNSCVFSFFFFLTFVDRRLHVTALFIKPSHGGFLSRRV